jgi:dipeptidyl-peptidase 4
MRATIAPRTRAVLLFSALSALSAFSARTPALEAQAFSIADVLSPPFAYDLVAAKQADRIAWLENERGRGNVYTAVAPEFRPVRVTAWLDDDGIDLTSLQMSADGEIVAFIRGHAPNRQGWVANPASVAAGEERAIWAVRTRGGEPWRVAAARSFALSPDGEWVAFAEDGLIHRRPVDPARTTDPAPHGVNVIRTYGTNANPVWSPDGTRIAFTSERDDHAFIGIYDTRSPHVRYLAPGVDRDASPTWSPDGRFVAFTRRPGLPYGARTERRQTLPDDAYPPGLLSARFRGGHDFTIWVADAQTGEGREVWRNTPEDTRFAEVRAIVWAGEHILFEAEPAEWRHWFAVAARGGTRQPIQLTSGDGFVEHTAVSPDGRWLYFATNIGDIDRRRVWRVPSGGGQATPLTGGTDIATFPAALATDGRVAMLLASERQPQSVAVLDAREGGNPRIITALPPTFPRDAHVAPTNVTLTAADGLAFNNQLFLPPDLRPGEQRPAMIFIHGGPRRQMLLGYNYGHFYHMAYAIGQYFASKGYVVLSVNYRAGIGYGRSFRTAPNVGRNGNAEYQDVLAAGEYLRDRADVDPTRIGIWGLSYGGILTAQALARNSELFASGVDIAGVHLWGDPLDQDSVNWRASSVSEIARWRSPVLLVHGDDDRNVAFSQTVGLVQMLRAHDVPFELIVFPDDVHSFLIHQRWVQTFEAADDFFDRTLIRKEPARAAPQ